MTTDPRAATDQMVMSLERTVAERAAHDHPAKGGDLFCLNLTSFMGERMGPVLARLRAAEAEIEQLAGELSKARAESFQPLAYSTGEQLFVHECRHTEWWSEKEQGPVNDQGCDACESSPFAGGWQPVYVRKAAGR